MELAQILQSLDSLVEKTDWSKAKIEAKVEVLKLLKICEPVLGKYTMEQWSLRLSTAFAIPAKSVQSLLDDLPSNIELLYQQPAVSKPTVDPYPKNGWIGTYLQYTLNNEAPLPFHFWTAVGVIGGVMGRRVFFDKAHYRVYPNHFIILVAPTGRCRKSTAIGIGIKLLRQLDGINILAEKITPEALVEALMQGKPKTEGSKILEECSGFIHAPELAVFLGKQVYNEGLVALLTGLSDNPDSWEYKTRTKKLVRLKNVNVSMLGASTPDWLYDSIPQAAFGGGFMSRIIFVVQDKTDRVLPFPPEGDHTIQDWLVEKLRKFSETKGQFVNSADGEEWYREWYSRTGAEKNKMEDVRLAGYFERKPDHLIRLSMVIAIAEEQGLLLTASLYQRALALLDTLEIPMPEAFISLDEAVFGSNARRIIRQLESHDGKLDHTSLLRLNYRYLDSRQFGNVLDTLKDAKLIAEIQSGGRRTYYLVPA